MTAFSQPRIALSILTLAVVAACAGSATKPFPTQRYGIEIDTTGIDVQRFDSLPRDYSSPPRIGDPSTPSMPPVPPLPVPASVRGTRVDVVFTIGPDGRITRLSLRPPADRPYARDLMESWLRVKFRPAFRADGTPTVGYYMLRLQF